MYILIQRWLCVYFLIGKILIAWETDSLKKKDGQTPGGIAVIVIYQATPQVRSFYIKAKSSFLSKRSQLPSNVQTYDSKFQVVNLAGRD